jgi:hypothetical protein
MAATQVLGTNLFQKSYLRHNLRAVLKSMDEIHSAYSGNFDVATCKLSNFAELKFIGEEFKLIYVEHPYSDQLSQLSQLSQLMSTVELKSTKSTKSTDDN